MERLRSLPRSLSGGPDKSWPSFLRQAEPHGGFRWTCVPHVKNSCIRSEVTQPKLRGLGGIEETWDDTLFRSSVDTLHSFTCLLQWTSQKLCDSQSVLSRVIQIKANETILSPSSHLLHAYCAAGAELGPGHLVLYRTFYLEMSKQWIFSPISIYHVASGFWFKDFLSEGSQMMPRKRKLLFSFKFNFF